MFGTWTMILSFADNGAPDTVAVNGLLYKMARAESR